MKSYQEIIDCFFEQMGVTEPDSHLRSTMRRYLEARHIGLSKEDQKQLDASLIFRDWARTRLLNLKFGTVLVENKEFESQFEKALDSCEKKLRILERERLKSEFLENHGSNMNDEQKAMFRSLMRSVDSLRRGHHNRTVLCGIRESITIESYQLRQNLSEEASDALKELLK